MIPNDKFLIEQVLDEADEHLSEANKYGHRYVDGIIYPINPNDYDSEMNESFITHNLTCVWLCILSMLERYEHPTLLEKAKSEYAEYLKNPLRTEMGPEEPYLYWPYSVGIYLNLLRSFYVTKDLKKITNKQKDVIDIIKSSGNFVASRKIFGFVPCKEQDVHDRLEELLSCSFKDVDRMEPISKPIKSFISDTSIPSVNILIEYKYVSSKDDCKLVVDQILADIGGYQSSKKELILFVIYETNLLYRSDYWTRAIKESNPPSSVQPILIHGIEPSQGDFDLRDKYETHIQSLKKQAKKRSANKHKTVKKK